MFFQFFTASHDSAREYLNNITRQSSNYETDTELRRGHRRKFSTKHSSSDSDCSNNAVKKQMTSTIPSPPDVPFQGDIDKLKARRSNVKTPIVMTHVSRRHAKKVEELHEKTISSQIALISKLKSQKTSRYLLELMLIPFFLISNQCSINN